MDIYLIASIDLIYSAVKFDVTEQTHQSIDDYLHDSGNVSQEIIENHYADLDPEIQHKPESRLSVNGPATIANVS